MRDPFPEGTASPRDSVTSEFIPLKAGHEQRSNEIITYRSDSDSFAQACMKQQTHKHSDIGDTVLLKVDDRLVFGTVVLISRHCLWTNAPLERGQIVGIRPEGPPAASRIYRYEPFEE